MVRSDYAITEDGKYFGLYTGNKAFEEYLINQKGESTKSKLLEFDTNSNKEKFEYSWSY